jgi:hypothetical protein
MNRVLVLINEMRSWGQTAKTGKLFCHDIALGASSRVQSLRAIEGRGRMPHAF